MPQIQNTLFLNCSLAFMANADLSNQIQSFLLEYTVEF